MLAYLYRPARSFAAVLGLMAVLFSETSAGAEEPPLPPPVVYPQPAQYSPYPGIDPDDLRAMQSRPPVQPAPTAERLPPWTGMNRYYFHVRPMWSLLHYVGGALISMGFEHMGRSGLLLGVDIAPAAILYPMMGVQGRVRIGYGGASFAIGAGAGGGVGTYDVSRRNDRDSYIYPMVGGFLRIGRLDRTYAELSVYVAVPQPYPFNALFHLSARTSERWRYKLDVGVEMLAYGPYLLMGGERQLHGNWGRNSSAINFGLGLLFPIHVFGIPGPMLSIGYEQRF